NLDVVTGLPTRVGPFYPPRPWGLTGYYPHTGPLTCELAGSVTCDSGSKKTQEVRGTFTQKEPCHPAHPRCTAIHPSAPTPTATIITPRSVTYCVDVHPWPEGRT